MAVKCGEANAQGKHLAPPAAMRSILRNQKIPKQEKIENCQIKQKNK